MESETGSMCEEMREVLHRILALADRALSSTSVDPGPEVWRALREIRAEAMGSGGRA